jgi:isopenicillin-N N-acyltransferase-like protein
MAEFPFPLVTIEGPPLERGRQYGRQARERIHAALRVYAPAWSAGGAGNRDALLARAREFAQVIRGRFPDLLEEMQGIAEGADLVLEDVVALNARTELLYGANSAQGAAKAVQDGMNAAKGKGIAKTAKGGAKSAKRKAQTPPDGCTGAVILPERSGGRVIIGQNWDWRPACRDLAILLRIVPEQGPRILTFVEAGMLARSGMNSAGIGLCGNFLQSDQDFRQSGVPIPLLRRAMLQSETLAQAVGAVLRSPRAFSSNHLLAHRDGEAIDLESSPPEVFTLFAEQGLLAHANHFKAAQGRVRDTGLARYPDSLFRDRRVLVQLNRQDGPLTADDLKLALQDHFGLPDSVCRHRAARADGVEIETVASVVMDLTQGVLWVAPGPVCRNEYRAFTLDGEVREAGGAVVDFRRRG